MGWIVNQEIGVSDRKNLHSDPINRYPEAGSVQADSSYTVPVNNKFQALNVEQEMQVSTVNEDSDSCGHTQDGSREAVHIAAVPSELNRQAISSVSDLLLKHSKQESLLDLDSILTSTEANSNLVP